LLEQCKKHEPWAVFLLGDLTEHKDNHSAKLVNRVVAGLVALANHVPVYMLRGNHDAYSEKHPFFEFLNRIEGLRFVTKPVVVSTGTTRCLMVPHGKTLPDLKRYAGNVDYVFLHQTFDGAVAESGTRLAGLNPDPLVALRPKAISMANEWYPGIFSGDIHKPQHCGPVTYVGAPYRVRFGDDYEPRVLLFEDTGGYAKNIYFPCPMRYSLRIREVSELENFELQPGDQVKITLELLREEFVEWPNRKQSVLDFCVANGLEVFGVELLAKQGKVRKRLEPQVRQVRNNAELLGDFCATENLAKQIRVTGEQILQAG
jgi:DNA repair exonuclease SbcCD nuclease subunit